MPWWDDTPSEASEDLNRVSFAIVIVLMVIIAVLAGAAGL